jgi:drug/metabolite transporter (DMT)-like permease
LDRRENTVGVIYLLLAAACWGFVAATVKTLTRSVDPQFISFTRVSLATLVVVALFAWRRGQWWRLQWFLPWILIGAVGRTINYLAFNLGLVYAPSNVAAIGLPVQTITTALLAWAIFAERLKGRGLGLALSLGGLALLWWNGQGLATLLDPRYALGNSLMFLSGVASGFSFISQKALTPRMSVLEMLIPVFGWSTLFITPFAWAGGGFSRAYAPATWALLIVLGVVLTGFSFIFLGEGYKRCSATTGVVVTNASVFMTLAFSASWMHESVSAIMVLGALLVVLGALAVVRVERREIKT